MSQAPSIRARIAAASRRIIWLKRADRAATGLIVLGGLAVVISVLGILFFIVAEALPLFRSATVTRAGVSSLEGVTGTPLALGVDEYQRFVYSVEPTGVVAQRALESGRLVRTYPIEGLGGAPVTAASVVTGDLIAAATGDGRVALAQLRFTPRYEESRLVDLDLTIRSRGLVTFPTAGRPIRAVRYREHEGRRVVAALVDDGINLSRTNEAGVESQTTLHARPGEALTCLALGRTETLVAGTSRGEVLHWELGDEPRLTDVSPISEAPVTALVSLLGDTTFVVGDARGGLSAWFRVRANEDAEPAVVRAHTFQPLAGPVAALAAATRDKSFAALGQDGSITLYFLTNERLLASLPGDGAAVTAAVVAPRNDALIALRGDNTVARFTLAISHPETSWRALFGRLWYEGYPGPDYVWQSTGATNDFEPKFSLIPLMFGTLKATFYALLFAVPVAVLGALYTSQFVHPAVRAKIKPTVEIMAALPSVVIGFIAGLWLAGLVERHVLAVLLMVGALPLAGTAGLLLWGALPRVLRRRLKPGTEIVLIVPLLVIGAWLSAALAPLVEAWLFRGDFRLWLSDVWGVTYDQRNSLVVGIAMGFAVIPIIFTISEDAFSSVPSSLTAASLALGASRWQTAIGVVLPTASPGIFSAVMIGFGRAVGETMIVLMATGNTPVLDWSIFNGMRTLSANIAVEIPEAPHGGSLYRILFLAGAVLFAMTFVVNTVAELIRQRLRERYRAL